MFDENVWLIVLLTIIGVVMVRLVVAFLLVGGDTRRLGLTIRASWRMLRDPEFAARVEPLLAPPVPKEEKPPKPSGAPLRLLALLQREGRLVDFLLEDIQAYPDDQIGAAVRDIHRQCSAALKEHVVLEPVLAQGEGATVEVPPGFDPSAIQLTGNVTGQPPFRGTLQHHGWRVKDLKLAAPPEGQDEFVLQPAEVELP
jgi:Domain of unknown function (DUF2760)